MKIKNYKTIGKTEDRSILLKIIERGIDAVLPEHVIQDNIKLDENVLKIQDKKFNLEDYKRIFVIGGGKASYEMAEIINQILKDKIKAGYVNSTINKQVGKITINKAGHPIPDARGVRGVRKMLSIKPKENDLVLCLISGGGSAMMPLPQEGITLKDLKVTNDYLLKAGASIYEINSVRKHLSQVKGGNLAARLYPATVISLIISDVVGDNLSVIASGPTAPDSSTFKDALLVLGGYGLMGKVPKSVIKHLRKGLEKKVNGTVKKGDKVFKKVHNFILANTLTALNAMKEEAGKQGLNANIINSTLTGEARDAGKYIAEELLKAKKDCALIFGGETTVTVKGKGLGGRNQELVLAMIEEIKDKNVTVASAGTDGIDFYKVAGAIADGDSYKIANKLKLDMSQYLENNDAYNFFKKMKDHIITGYTGTNVCDVIIGVKR